LIDTKQFKEALEVIERLPADVNDARRLALTGYCKAGMDLSDDADEYADKAQVRDDSSAMALNLKGIVAFKRGDRATASDYFDKAKKADPGYGEPYTNLGVIRWSEGNHAEGLDLLEKGFILSPMSGDSVDAYYSAISQTGSFDRMETTLRDALSLFPSSRRIAFLLIDCLIRQGKDRVAILEIEQSMITYGIDDGMLSAALAVRGKVGAKEIDASKKDANISLCMIVKNEESNLGKCLLNTNALVDEIIVVDTGSTDRTRDIAKSFGAKVYDFEWTHDFSEARNVSLSKSKGDWILVLDADEVISPRDFDALKKLVGRKKRGNAYSITTRNYVDCANVEGWTRNDGFYIMEEAGTGWLPSFKVRLFPNDANIRFENPVHELVEPSLRKAGKKILNCKVPIHHYGKLNSEKCLVKGEAYYQLGRKKLDEQGDEVMPLLELAVQASELEKYEEAVDLLQRLLKLEPNSAKAYFNLGYLYLKLGYYPEGIRSSKRALEIDPNIKEAILNYASCEVYGGDVNNAITALEDMLNKNPGHPSASALLATAYIIGGKVDEGIACIEKIKKMKADCPGVILNHAREFERAGRIDFTLLLLETAVRYGYVNSGILSMLEGLKKR
jgi:tetratricopeptide (TPR) repeat protein